MSDPRRAEGHHRKDGGRRQDPHGQPPDPLRDPSAAVVAALRRLAQLSRGPRPAFRAALRRRLVREASAPRTRPTHAPPARRGRGAAHRAPRDRRQQRRAVVVVATLATGVVGVMSTSATARSLPGDPFFPVKQAAQEATFVATMSDRARGERQLDLAAARLADVRRLVDRDSPHSAAAVRTALREMDSLTHSATLLLTGAYHRTRDIRPLNVLDAFTRRQRAELSALLPRIPWQARAKAGDSLSLVETIHRRTVTMLAQSCRTDASCATTSQAVPGTTRPAP